MNMFKKIYFGLDIIYELSWFLWKRKLWWLIPSMLVLLAFSVLFIFVQGTVIGPFMYAMF